MRTRKWRPSIQDAFDQVRPSSMLLEDSVRIFDNKQVRPIQNWDADKLFAFNSELKEPVKSWKKKPAAKGTRAKSAAKGPKAKPASKGTKAKYTKRGAGSKKKKGVSQPEPASVSLPALPSKPSTGGDVMDAPLDLSPCTAYLNAGGGTLDMEVATDDADVGGKFEAI